MRVIMNVCSKVLEQSKLEPVHLYAHARVLCEGLSGACAYLVAYLCVCVRVHVVFGQSSNKDWTASEKCLQGIRRSKRQAE